MDFHEREGMNPKYGSNAHIEAASGIIAGRSKVGAPKVGIILGTGLAPVAHDLADSVTIPYSELPGFAAATAPGHFGRLHVGRLGGAPVAAMQGRFHLYEGHDPRCWLTPIRALRKAGVETLVITNAVGGFHADWPATCLMLVNDHINGIGSNPLVGPNEPKFGPRFPDMSAVYDQKLREIARRVAQKLGIGLKEGVYYAMLGPVFETPAEIRMMRMLGADVVGMSLVPEAIVARHCGMKLLAISAITNHAAGINPKPLTEQEVIEGGNKLSRDLSKLISGIVSAIAADES